MTGFEPATFRLEV